MSEVAKRVPRWVRVVTFVLSVLTIAFGIAGYIDASVLFPGGTGLDSAGAAHASREFSARNLAVGLALLVVSFVGVPESMAIVMIVRGLIEAQTIIISLAEGAAGPGLILPAALLTAELVVVRVLFGIAQNRSTKHAT